MKTSFVPRLFVLLYLCASFTQMLAAPTRRNNGGEDQPPATTPTPTCSVPTPTPSTAVVELRPAAKTFIKWLGENGASHPKICFYSGSTDTTGVWRNMDKISTKLGCDWITSLLHLAGIPDSETAEWTDVAEWSATSSALARIARHDATVILGKTYSESSVWKTLELPSLRLSQYMGYVSKIEQYTMADADGDLEGPIDI
ncbi:hypothetical protein MD484_g4418, partial [Candolleomyces efflorescens]